MKMNALDYYICKACGRSKLVFGKIETTSHNGEIIKASLSCNNCNASFEVENGIPRFVPKNNYTDSFGFQWNIHDETQLDSYTGLPISRNRLFEVTLWPERMEGQVILEAGSGAGRFTEILLGTGATILSFDFSSAVDANWENNGHQLNLNLFQGDIYDIPLQKDFFDKVICLGVIQHTPDPEKSFKSLVKHVRPGGELVIDVYTKSLISLVQWKYLLRPLTKRIKKETLYKIIQSVVPLMIPISIFLRRFGGRVGSRLMPIVEYSNLGLPYELNKQWSILDTFDMYSPEYDYPQTISTIKRWYNEAGFENVVVRYGPNGIVAKGFRSM